MQAILIERFRDKGNCCIKGDFIGGVYLPVSNARAPLGNSFCSFDATSSDHCS